MKMNVTIVGIVLLVLIAGGVGYVYFNGSLPPPPPPNGNGNGNGDGESIVLSNALQPIITPTWDGSGQATHPDVIHFVNGFQGGLTQTYTYVMAMTPYPYRNAAYENPSILVSNTPGTAFYTDNIDNPLDDRPYPRVNSDTDLVYKDGVFYCYYVEVYCPNPPTDCGYAHNLRTSTNLVSWSEEQKLTGINCYLLSPAIIYDPDDNVWKMWGICHPGWNLQYYESSNGLDWTFIQDTDFPTYPYGDERHIWHLDVQKTKISKKYYALVYPRIDPPELCGCLIWAESPNGRTGWNVASEEIITCSSWGWDDTSLYRGSFLIENSKLKVWYCGISASDEWRLGYTEGEFNVAAGEETLNVIS